MEITKEMKISWVLTREEYEISHFDPKSIVGLLSYADRRLMNIPISRSISRGAMTI